MRPPLQVQELSIIKPLLITIAKIISKNGIISRSEIRLLALGEGINSEDIIWELELFSKILLEVKKNNTLQMAKLALNKRGLSNEEANNLIELIVVNQLRSEDQTNYLDQPILKLRGKFKLGPSIIDDAKRIIGKGNSLEIIPYANSSIVIISTCGAELFDLQNNNTLWNIFCPCEKGRISPEGDLLVLQKEKNFYFWDLNTGNLIENIEISDENEDFFFDSNQQKIILVNYDSIEKWDIHQKKREFCIDVGEKFDVERVRVNSDFSFVALLPKNNIGFYNENLEEREFKDQYGFLEGTTFKCWELFNGNLVWEIKDIFFADFDSKWEKIVTCFRDHFDIWDFYSQKKTHTLKKDHTIDIVRFHPKLNQIAIGSNGIVEIYQLTNNLRVNHVDIFNNYEFYEDQKIISRLDFSPNGKFLFVVADIKETNYDEDEASCQKNDYFGYPDYDHRIKLILNSDLSKKIELDSSWGYPLFSLDEKIMYFRKEIIDLVTNKKFEDNFSKKFNLVVENIKYHPKNDKIVISSNKILNLQEDKINLMFSIDSESRAISKYISEFTEDGKYIISKVTENYGYGEDYEKEDDVQITTVRDSSNFTPVIETSNSWWGYDPNNEYFAVSEREADEVFNFYSFESPFGINILDLRTNWENDLGKNPDNEVIKVFQQKKHRIKRIPYFEKIKNFKFYNDGSKIVVLSEGNILRIWDLFTYEDKGFKFDSNVELISVNKKNEILLEVGDSWKSTYIVILNENTWGVKEKFATSWNKIRYSKDIATLLEYQHKLNLEIEKLFRNYEQFKCLKKLNYLFWIEKEKIISFDITNKNLLIPKNQRKVKSFDISQDEREIIVGYSDGLILLYDLSVFLKDYVNCESN